MARTSHRGVRQTRDRQARNEPYKGIHSVYSGFNEAFKKYFAGHDPIPLTNQMARTEDRNPAGQGGVLLYLPKTGRRPPAAKSLVKMGLL